MKKLLTLFVAAICALSLSAQLQNGEIWQDTAGEHINAHGGGIMRHGDTYWWYGENRGQGGGVRVYSSTDLVNWENRGVALELVDSVGHDIERGCNIERPKVVYNAATGKFVMWFHLELKDRGYSAARAGVAVSDTPQGPFCFIRSGRVNPGIAAEGDTTTFGEYYHRDIAGGQMARDMTLFVDTDGRAYHIYSSEENYTLHIAELTSDYLSHTGRYVRMAPGGHNEAPALFVHDGRYWLIASGCTGWDPNRARLFTADNIWGPWTELPNPCQGENADRTFGAQSTFALPLPDGRIIVGFDVWRPKNLRDSRYIWLPVTFTSDGTPTLYFTPIAPK